MRGAAAILAVLALPAMADEPPGGVDLALLEGCLAETEVPQGCIGAAAGACIAAIGGQAGAGVCYGQEAAYWEGRIDAAMDRLAGPGAAAEAFADRVGWPEPRPSMAAIAAAFEAHRAAACDMAGALWGGGSGAGPAWAECRMQLAAEHAMRLERWEGWQ